MSLALDHLAVGPAASRGEDELPAAGQHDQPRQLCSRYSGKLGFRSTVQNIHLCAKSLQQQVQLTLAKAGNELQRYLVVIRGPVIRNLRLRTVGNVQNPVQYTLDQLRLPQYGQRSEVL